MADKEQNQVAGWSAAAIAAETSEHAALEIINRMELAEEYCDPTDWQSLSQAFGDAERLTTAIYSYDTSIGV